MSPGRLKALAERVGKLEESYRKSKEQEKRVITIPRRVLWHGRGEPPEGKGRKEEPGA